MKIMLPNADVPLLPRSPADAVALLPRQKGTYTVLFEVNAERRIPVNSLGEVSFQRGIYVYVGSARGAGGLRARTGRHILGTTSLHYDVGHMKVVARPAGVWYTADDKKRECLWAAMIAQMEGAEGLAGFGSKDTRCETHLFHFRQRPVLAVFQSALRQAEPDHAAILEIVISGSP